jgi:hypothetical protein
VDAITLDSGHGSSPSKINPCFRRVLSHLAMQGGSPHTYSASRGKAGVYRYSAIDKANATERKTLTRVDVNPKLVQSKLRVRHQPFPTGLVDRRHGSIGQTNAKSSASRGDGHRQPSRSTAGDKHISIEMEIQAALPTK